MKNSCFLLFFLLFQIQFAFSQCGPIISSFPYFEDFELNDGGWVSGGTGNDWARGIPAKTFINNAGSGGKCWVTGGLSGSFYTNGQRSYVLSPCFNFSSLTRPVISLKIYWESENNYDGACLQYSLNNGATWVTVGNAFDAASCLNQNWYNHANILNLNTLANPKDGWAGTVLPSSGSCQGGNGSNGWVLAKRCIQNLAGEPQVRFRICFGAGTACNAFDGFAFDAVQIEEGTPVITNFAFTCTNTLNEYVFANLSSPCPNNFVWNFGDPSSGSNNGSGQLNPSHTFTTNGTYVVTLTASDGCGSTASIQKTISTVSMSATATNALCTNSSSASISANATGGTTPFTFTLVPVGITSSSGNFTNVPSGTYSVIVNDANGCTAQTSVTISSPPQLTMNSVTQTNITCFGLQDGSIQVNASGGTGSLLYTLLPSGISNALGNFNSLAAGNYTVIASDANACTISTNVSITSPNVLQITSLNKQDVQCFDAKNGSIKTSNIGGAGVIQFTLLPNALINTSGEFNFLSGGVYTVICTDANGCSTSSTTLITEPTALQITSTEITQPTCVPNHDGVLTILANGGVAPYSFSIGGIFTSTNTFTNLSPNNYTIRVKDANGCEMNKVVILLNENAPIFQSTIITNPACFGDKNGSISALASGIHPITNYYLEPTSISNSNGEFLSLSAGVYTIRVVDDQQCSNSTMVTVSEPLALTIDTIAFQQTPCGSNISNTLVCQVNGGTGGIKYNIQPGNLFSSDGKYQQLAPGNYTLSVVDDKQCKAIKTFTIPERICCEDVFIPNAFSPNGDGNNDEFKMPNIYGIAQTEFIVFTRWGNIAFQARNYLDAWDGKIKGIEAEVGTYFYQIRYTCLQDGKKYIRSGDVILVR